MPLRPSYDLHVGRRTDVGRVRQSNEDSLLALELVWSNTSVGRPAGLFVVADGMGGHEGGEIASGMLVQAIARLAVAEWLPRLAEGEAQDDHGEWLAGAIQSANERIYDWARQAGLEMGTTIVAALLTGDRGHIAHVGDSRAYRINGAGPERLTIDHSLVESLVVANQISREEARDHPQVNVIYRTIGDKEQVEIDVSPVRLARGDALLLCSDGLTGMLTDESIHQIVSAAASPQAACDALIDAANKAGGEDNITVMIIKLESLPPVMAGQA
jgi:protein phosphatase